MNKQELLQKIKDDVAHEAFGLDWHDVIWDHQLIIWPEINKRYAIAMCEEQKKACAENATAFLDANDNPIVAKGSILNTKNVAE